jgi:hypothetical protein
MVALFFIDLRDREGYADRLRPDRADMFKPLKMCATVCVQVKGIDACAPPAFL